MVHVGVAARVLHFLKHGLKWLECTDLADSWSSSLETEILLDIKSRNTIRAGETHLSVCGARCGAKKNDALKPS